MSDLEHLRQLDPRSLRDYLKDGNYGGYYQREDEEMMKDLACRRGRNAPIVDRSLVDNGRYDRLSVRANTPVRL